ncbi:MAG: hypothetical protein R6W88_03825 [Desulfobacterales bacterium]
MEVKDYCSNVDMELTLWKAKIFDTIRKADQLGSAELEKILPNIQDLKMVVTELEDRIHQLRVECPLEWKPIRDEIEGVKGNLTNTYDLICPLMASPMPMPSLRTVSPAPKI